MSDEVLLQNVPDQTGTMVLSATGEIVTSSGDLLDSTQIGAAIYNMVLSSQRLVSSVPGDAFRRLAVIAGNAEFVVTVSDSKVYVVKRPSVQATP